jgi:hypothetical protein
MTAPFWDIALTGSGLQQSITANDSAMQNAVQNDVSDRTVPLQFEVSFDCRGMADSICL